MSQIFPINATPPASAQPRAADSGQTAATPRRISSTHLLGADRAIEIEHGGRVYQLRITQLNKLILTA